jgi:hypothetical protein
MARKRERWAVGPGFKAPHISTLLHDAADWPDRQLVFFPGPAGWTSVIWRFQQPDEIEAHVRFELRDGRFDAVELRLGEPWLDRLREIPLRRIENAVRASARVQQLLRDRYDEPASGFPGETVFRMGPTRAELARDRFKLTRPAKRRLPDEFYYDVSIAYTDAVEAGLNPRKTLAADSGAPADTVARWIGEARKRGHLPPGEPGKVTA